MVLDCTYINCNLVSSDRELALIEDFAPVVVAGKLLKCVITIRHSSNRVIDLCTAICGRKPQSVIRTAAVCVL